MIYILRNSHSPECQGGKPLLLTVAVINFSDGKCDKKLKSILGWGENIVEKGKMVVDRTHFLMFPSFFRLPFHLRVVKSLDRAINSTKRQNFRLVRIKSICRRQNKCNLKTEILLGMVRKHCGKGENAGYQHFLLFPQCFQKASFSRSLKV